MKQIRSLLIIFAFAFFGTGAAFLNFLIFPFAKLLYKNEHYQYFASDTIRTTWKFFIRFLEFLKLIKLNIKNPEKLEEIKNKVIVSTHPSFIDIVILVAFIPRCTCFVKSALCKNPILNNLVNSIFIPNDIDIENLKVKSKKYLDIGFNVIIFPSGIRHRKNEYPKIQKGAAMIALNSNKNIIPIKLYSSDDFLFINQPFYVGGDKTVIFDLEVCNPITLEEFSNPSEIIAKRKITQEIEKVFYK